MGQQHPEKPQQRNLRESFGRLSDPQCLTGSSGIQVGEVQSLSQGSKKIMELFRNLKLCFNKHPTICELKPHLWEASNFNSRTINYLRFTLSNNQWSTLTPVSTWQNLAPQGYRSWSVHDPSLASKTYIPAVWHRIWKWALGKGNFWNGYPSFSLIFQLFWIHVNHCNCNLGNVLPLSGCELLNERLDPGFWVTRIQGVRKVGKQNNHPKKTLWLANFDGKINIDHAVSYAFGGCIELLTTMWWS